MGTKMPQNALVVFGDTITLMFVVEYCM